MSTRDRIMAVNLYGVRVRKRASEQTYVFSSKNKILSGDGSFKIYY